MEDEANTLSLKNLKKLEKDKKFKDWNKENLRDSSLSDRSDSEFSNKSGIEINSNNSGSCLNVQSGSGSYKTESSLNSFNTVSSGQSMISFLTIHSKAGGQHINDHWVERAAERGDLDLDDEQTKKDLFRDLKSIMQKNPGNIIQSSKNPDRFLVAGQGGLHFVLRRTKQRNQSAKIVYVPITVLAPGMKAN